MTQDDIQFAVNVLASLAAVSLAWFAWVEIRRGRKVTERANAEVAANAYVLRQNLGPLRALVGKGGTTSWHHLHDMARRAIAEGEVPALAMVSAAGGAADKVATPARNAFVLFYKARDEYDILRSPNDSLERLRAALDSCMEELSRAIVPVLGQAPPQSVVMATLAALTTPR